MKKITVLIAAALILGSATASTAGEKYDFNCFRTPRSYGNWQNGQQFSDSRKVQQYNTWTTDGNGQTHRSDKGWQQLYENSADFNSRYNTFFGRNNNYDD